jgi:hypothetical protein
MRSSALVRVVTMLAVSCAQRAADARDADVATLRMWELPAYTLIAKDGSDPRYIVQRLANTERAVSKLLATPVKPTTVPTYVWLLPRAEWNRYLAPSWAIASEFVPRRFANYLIVNADLGPTEMREAVQHEYTHFFLRTQWGGLYPLWFDEGVAGLVGTARIFSSRAVFGPSEAASIGTWIEMQRLFEIDKTSREYLSPASTESVHGESWAIVHRGLLSEPPFGDKMFAYLAAINRLVAPGDAMTQSFGMSFPELDSSMRTYLKERPLPVGRVKFEGAPPATVPEGRVLDSTAALEALAFVMLDTGFQPAHTAEVIDTVNRLAPGAPRALVLKLRLAVRDRKDAEALRLADALKTNDDVATLRDTGLALFERVHEPVGDDPMSTALRADFEVTAFSLLDRALRIDPGDPAAAWGYALLAVRLHERVDTALERLAAARTRMPGHPDLAEATALALEARGEEDAMMPYLLDALRNTSSAEQRARAAHRILELRIKEREKAPQ